jgi:hypothetical protein
VLAILFMGRIGTIFEYGYGGRLQRTSTVCMYLLQIRYKQFFEDRTISSSSGNNLFLCQARCICKLTEISFLTVCLNQLPWESRKIRVFVYIYVLILNQVIQMYYFVHTYSILYMLVELSPVLLLLLRTWGFHYY